MDPKMVDEWYAQVAPMGMTKDYKAASQIARATAPHSKPHQPQDDRDEARARYVADALDEYISNNLDDFWDADGLAWVAIQAVKDFAQQNH